MRGRLLAAALSSMMILLLLAPNVLMAQSEVQTMHSIAVKGDSFDIKPLKPIVSCSWIDAITMSQ
jgi:hypothetical protein